MKQLDTVWVRNNGVLHYADRYDGEDFEVPPGGACEMLSECAALCFGFGEEGKGRVLSRNGWATPQKGESAGEAYARAIARLNSFSFHMTEAEAKNSQVHLSAPVGPDAAAVSGNAAVVAAGPKKRAGPLDKLAQAGAG